jgi:hypothetical protein
MDSPQTPHRDAELLRYLHFRRGGPMEAIPVGVLPGQLSRSLVNPVPVSRLQGLDHKALKRMLARRLVLPRLWQVRQDFQKAISNSKALSLK